MLDWAIARQAGRLATKLYSTLTFNQYVSVESFVGGKVRAIRVIDHEPHLTAAQIKEEVQRVWFGVFRDATCSIGWSEGNN